MKLYPLIFVLVMPLGLPCAATAPGDLHTKNFGCIGNGSTDDTVCMQNAINSAQSSGSRLFLDPGTYLISSALTISHPIVMLGGGPSVSRIKVPNGIDGIDITSLSQTQMYNFKMLGAFGATAGSLINVSPNGTDSAYNVFRDIYFDGGYIGLNMGNAILWTVDRAVFDHPTAIGVLTQNITNPDQGDSTISNSIFRLGSSGTSIWQTSSGGLRIKNNKFLSGQHGYMLALNSGVTTSDLLIEGNSFEQQSVDSITAVRGSGGTFANIAITGNQFALAPTSINFSDTSSSFLNVVSVGGNVFRGNGSGYVAIKINGTSVFDISTNTVEGQGGNIGVLIGSQASNGKVCGNQIHGFTTQISNASGSTTTTC